MSHDSFLLLRTPDEMTAGQLKIEVQRAESRIWTCLGIATALPAGLTFVATESQHPAAFLVPACIIAGYGAYRVVKAAETFHDLEACYDANRKEGAESSTESLPILHMPRQKSPIDYELTK